MQGYRMVVAAPEDRKPIETLLREMRGTIAGRYSNGYDNIAIVFKLSASAYEDFPQAVAAITQEAVVIARAVYPVEP